MKRVMILSFAAALLATGCTSKSTVKTPGIDLSNLDTTVACGDDFYDYACGGWMKKNPLKPGMLVSDLSTNYVKITENKFDCYSKN